MDPDPCQRTWVDEGTDPFNDAWAGDEGEFAVIEPGLYEQLLTEVLRRELDSLDARLDTSSRSLRAAEAADRIAIEELRAKRDRSPYSDWQRREIGPRQMKVNFMPRLGQIDTRTLIIHGAADKLVPVKIAKEAAQRIPNARLHVLDGCGHWSPRERPAEVNAAVREFLSP